MHKFIILASMVLSGCALPLVDSGEKGERGEQGERGEAGPQGFDGKDGLGIGETVFVSSKDPVDDLVYVKCPETHPVLLTGGCMIDRWASLSAFGPTTEKDVNEKTDSDDEVWVCVPGMTDSQVYETKPPTLKAWAKCGAIE